VLWDKKPPAWLARVVAPSSHPYERGGERRLFFVICERPQWSKTRPLGETRRMIDECDAGYL